MLAAPRFGLDAGVTGMAILQAVTCSLAQMPAVIGASILWTQLFRGAQQVPSIFADFVPANTSGSRNIAALLDKARPVGDDNQAVASPGHATATHIDVLGLVTTMVNGMLGAAVPPDQPLMEAGLDSLGEWKSEELSQAKLQRLSSVLPNARKWVINTVVNVAQHFLQ